LLIKFNVRAGVVWIVAGTIWTASDLCIAIGAVTIAVGWMPRSRRKKVRPKAVELS
jgi:hypothetical protein